MEKTRMEIPRSARQGYSERSSEAGGSPERGPLVSVVMPMRNAANYVREALMSVLSEVEIDLEVVVIDDGSSDDSRSIVDSFGDARISVLPGPQRGFAASLNTGIQAARGEIVMECDADDLYVLGRIRTQVRWLMEHPECDAVCGAFSTIDSKGKLVAHLVEVALDADAQEISSELSAGSVRTHFCTFAFRRRVFSRIGLLREYFETGPDIDFQLRLGEQCRVAFLPQRYYQYRLHEQSITHTQAASRRLFFEATAFAFQKERQKTGTDSLARGSPPDPPLGLRDAPSTAERQIQGMLIGRSWNALREGNPSQAIVLALRAIITAPLYGEAWKSMIKLLFRAGFPKRAA